MLQQGRFDLAALNTHALQLHLKIRPAENLDHAVGLHATEITGAIQPLVELLVVIELFGRAQRRIDIPERHTSPPQCISPVTPTGHGSPASFKM